MERHLQVQAVVVRNATYGEIHRTVTLFSKQLGIIKAFIFGGRKGKKTSVAPLFSIGSFLLYYNPVSDQYSVAEEDCSFIARNIKSDLYATYTASYLCEVISSVNTDEFTRTFSLLSEALITLDGNLKLRTKVLIDFTWKFIILSGLGSDLRCCPNCDKVLKDDEILFFSTAITSPVCKKCSDTDTVILLPGVRRYLIYTYNMSFSDSFKVELLDGATEKLKTFLLAWISAFTRFTLKTIQSNML